MLKKNILITGCTGNLGSQLLKLMLNDNRGEINFFLLVRAENNNRAKEKIWNACKHVMKDRSFLKKNIKILLGDISKKRLGLNRQGYNLLTKNIDTVYHSAAATRFHDHISILRLVNVVGTQRILDFISENKNPVKLNYISTAFIAGNFNGKFRECDFNLGQKFNNPYEQSKFEAEEQVRSFSKDRKNIRIFRPSIIIGSYQTGSTVDFQMFYKPLYLVSQGAFEEIPFNKSTFLNLIPVDIAAKMILILSNNETSNNNVFHIVSPNPFKVLEIINASVSYYHFQRPILSKKIKFKNNVLEKLYKKSVKPFFDYFTLKAHFECKETQKTLQNLDFYFPALDNAFLTRVFDYTVKRKYINRKNRF